MTIEIKEKLTGSILDIGGGGEAVIGQIYKDRVTAIDNCKEELEEAPDCCSKQLMDATELSFPDDSFDNVTRLQRKAKSLPWRFNPILAASNGERPV